METNELNEKLAKLGVKRFVRNVALQTMKEYSGKPEKTEEALKEINVRLLEQFKLLANEEIDELMAQMAEKLKG